MSLLKFKWIEKNSKLLKRIVRKFHILRRLSEKKLKYARQIMKYLYGNLSSPGYF